jgi:hypothetical protein
MEFATGEAILRQAVGVQGREVVARADDDRLSLDWPPAGLDLGRGCGVDRGLAQKGYLEALVEPGGKLGARLARFNARFVGAIERPGEFARSQT